MCTRRLTRKRPSQTNIRWQGCTHHGRISWDWTGNRHHLRKGWRNVTITGRHQESLDKLAALIHATVPGAQILPFRADVRDPKATEAAVKATLKRFGRLDVVIANAGIMNDFENKLDSKDPDLWWNTFEVNIRGTFNTVRFVFSVLSLSRQYPNSGKDRHCWRSRRLAGVLWSFPRMVRSSASEMQATMLLRNTPLNRLVEFIALEYPKLTVFSLHPGGIKTETAEKAGLPFPDDYIFDTLQLPAATMLYLTSGRIDWLNGKYLAANWDISEIERDWKEKIQAGGPGGVLINKLAIPK
ncbi:NAD-P-binding protein [Lactarius hengduanensis]|nr:NAD-P-binding protein [Lactarius hengduanensis]